VASAKLYQVDQEIPQDLDEEEQEGRQ